MLGKIKRLGTDTLIYGVMTVTGRFLTFMLVPFYTNLLLPEEYGIVAYLFSLIAFLTIFFSYGMESAYFKYASTREIGTEEQNFATPFFSLLATSAVLASGLTLFSMDIAALAGFGATGGSLVAMAAWILFFDTGALIPFAALRLRHRAGVFAAVKLVNILTNVSLNVYFLAFLGMGVGGVFLAGLTASAVTFLLLLIISRSALKPAFNANLLRALLKFGIPYVPAGVAGIALQVIDRPLLRFLIDDASVGIYQANYRLGIVIMLLVSTFDYAYRPFFLNIAREPDAKAIYARTATYFYALMAFVCITVTVFVGDIVRLEIAGRYLIHPDYWGGLAIVPVVMLAYIFTGWISLLMPGIFIEKKTNYLPLVTGIAAGVNIAANLLLIPPYGILGAAAATLIGYVVYAAGMYRVSQKFYPVRYETRRLAIVTAAFVLCAGGAYYLYFPGGYAADLRIQLIIVATFPIILFIGGFFERDEKQAIIRIFGGKDR
jgi:O-antigen/teichoic acid export membrane protein